MKRMLWIAAAAVMLLAACEKEDNGVRFTPQEVQNALTARYPDAVGVAWTTRGGYYVAEFAIPGSPSTADNTAWFDITGVWYMTEYDMPYTSLPQAVQDAFRGGEYGAWELDDVDRLEREGMETVYVIEVEGYDATGREVEMDLYYSPDGVLVKAVENADAGYDYADFIPDALVSIVKGFIEERYPNARILEINGERGLTEIDILDGQTQRELYFEASGQWVRTETELRLEEVPQAVRQAFAASEYARYGIEDAELVETPEGVYYRIETEVNDRDTYLHYDATGQLLTM